MTRTALALRGIRKDLGFPSARAFFHFLKTKKAADFNYSYFVRVDGGKVLPSQKVISTIAKNLERLQADELIQAYCADIFPEANHLFSGRRIYTVGKTETVPLTAQQMLTPLQVSILSKSETHYFIFLILTLSRGPIQKADLKQSPFLKSLDRALEDLIEEKILGQQGDTYYSMSNEFRFPEADSDQLRDLYKKLNDWDRSFDQFATPMSVYDKTFIRRMSRQYLEMVNHHLDLIFELIRSAEHVSPVYNDEVVKIVFKVNQGRLPG